MTPSIFISHSRIDREIASEIDLVLRENGAQTFLDQRELGPGDILPANLQAGIENCSLFLLLWSRSAASSTWVSKEWNLAYAKHKRIIPYTVAGFGLPSPLNNFIAVDGDDDRRLAHSNLLTAVFGKEWQPRGAVFAGVWEAHCSVFGLTALYRFELRLNGQVIGSTAFPQLAGIIGPGMANMTFPLVGSWTYQAGVLNLTLTVEALGQRNTETIQIVTRGGERDDLEGHDLKGLIWRLKRVSAGL